jgi:hypothetical protein
MTRESFPREYKDYKTRVVSNEDGFLAEVGPILGEWRMGLLNPHTHSRHPRREIKFVPGRTTSNHHRYEVTWSEKLEGTRVSGTLRRWYNAGSGVLTTASYTIVPGGSTSGLNTPADLTRLREVHAHTLVAPIKLEGFPDTAEGDVMVTTMILPADIASHSDIFTGELDVHGSGRRMVEAVSQDPASFVRVYETILLRSGLCVARTVSARMQDESMKAFL